MLDAKFYDSLRGLRLAVGHKSSMNLSGNRKSVQKGTSAEFSDFREYLPGDDIRRIDWNAYGRLDRLYIKEYMEEKEALISILIDTSSSMDYGTKKKSELARELAAALAYMGLNNMDRVAVYDMQRMHQPFVVRGGKKAFPRLAGWLEQCSFDGQVDIGEAVRKLPGRGQGAAIIISDFLQESFLPGAVQGKQAGGSQSVSRQREQSGVLQGEDRQGKRSGGQPGSRQRKQSDNSQSEAAGLLRFLAYRRQRPVFLQVLAGEELSVDFTGTRNLIDMEDKSILRLTVDAAGLRAYENALNAFTAHLGKECAGAGAFYAVCSTARDFHQLIFKDLRLLYDI